MLVPKNSLSIARICIARTAVLGVPVLALTLGACSRDELAPDCFKIDPDTGVCLIPDPGGTAAGINCATMPAGAVGATYSFTPEVGGGSGNFTQWTATNLPASLTIDPTTGTISGVPTEPNAYDSVVISMLDAGKGETFEASCGELVINPSLNASLVAMEDNFCIDSGASKADMLALLQGGDGTEITCSPLNPSDSTTCSLGDGNGTLAPGVSFDASTCTHSGSIVGDRRGTWVWMVEVTQSDYTTRVPFCATRDVDTFHDIAVTAQANPQSDLIPGILEYDPANSVAFGSGQYQWEITNPACPGADCSTFGFRFAVSCSPFDLDAPWMVSLSPSAPTETGLTHEMTASGPAPDPKFDGRPWVASFDISYCTSATAGFCDTADSDQFEQNAQTKYHFDVVAYPEL